MARGAARNAELAAVSAADTALPRGHIARGHRAVARSRRQFRCQESGPCVRVWASVCVRVSVSVWSVLVLVSERATLVRVRVSGCGRGGVNVPLCESV